MFFLNTEPRQKVPPIKFRSPTLRGSDNSPPKRSSDSFLLDKSHRTLFESGGEGTSKSSVGNTNRQVDKKATEQKMKDYVDLERSLFYVEEDTVLLLIFAKSEDKGKLESDKTFTYGKLQYIAYENSDVPNLLLMLKARGGFDMFESMKVI